MAYQNLTNHIHMHSYKSHSSDTKLDLNSDTTTPTTDIPTTDYDAATDISIHTHSSNYWDSRHTLTHTTTTAWRRLIVHNHDWQDTVTDVTGTE